MFMTIVLVLIIFALVFLIEFMERRWSKERAEYVKMLAARSYTEYAAYENDGKDKKPPPGSGKKKSLIISQQRKIIEDRKRE